MGHTNSTANLSLPQFIGTDKPTWLGDVNGAFGAIDTAVGTINADILAVDAKADNAVADASSAVTVANNANTTAGTASTTATTANNIANNALTVANNADGHTNQLEQKIGLLADLHTTDKTSIVNAINEVADGGSGSPSASAVSYDNTDSGLTATNVQDAIDELAQGGGGGARSLIGSSSTTGTYADKVAEIKTLFDTLTTDRKRNSFILYNSRIMPLITDQGVYSATFTTGTGFEIDTVNLTTSKVLVNEAGTITDNSNVTNALVFDLYA